MRHPPPPVKQQNASEQGGWLCSKVTGAKPPDGLENEKGFRVRGSGRIFPPLRHHRSRPRPRNEPIEDDDEDEYEYDEFVSLPIHLAAFAPAGKLI